MSAQARNALAAWGGGSKPPRLIKQRENAVFEVRLADGRKAALRLHRPGYKTRSEIRSELTWMQALSEAGFPAPRPIVTRGGTLVHALESGLLATMITWVEGTAIGSSEEPLAGTPADQAELFSRIGALLADLHTIADGLGFPPDFTRPSWDRDALTGPDPLWGRYWQNPILDADERRLILAARDAARARMLARAGCADVGLIHADALRENIFVNGTRLTLIDFDDSGFGDRLYDLATALSQSLDDANIGGQRQGLIAGYRSHRPLSEEANTMLPIFVMLRTFASLGWAIPRLPPDHPKMPTYKRRALKMARAFIDGRDPLT